MNYPLISEYIEAIKASEENFEQLKHLRPVLDEDGEPVMSSGNFAVVFKMTDGKKNYAVKCFTKPQDGRDSAYRLISEELQKIQSPYILKVRYLDKELFVDTTQTDETEFPVLLMDWVEGQTLSSFLQNISNNYDEDYSFWSEEEEKTALFELKCLPYNFIRAASWLIKQPYAHGDIKPDNIIIKPDGTCVLVDYDGMYVPAMQGMKIQCMGTPNFRYPKLNYQRFDNSLDNYSISIIALSLCAFALEPTKISECDDFCVITEKETSKLHEHRLFKDEVLMSDNFFRDLLAIYLHTLSQNKLDSDFFDSCISEYLCPDNYDISSTKVSDFEKDNYWEDLYGVRYSLDGRKVISASKELKGVDYTIREGVLTVCNQAFQSKGLHSITLPESVVAIGDRTFANNDDMEYCNIPSSVKFIYDNNPWGGCFSIKEMDCASPSYLIKDGILYSSDFYTVYGFIYWNSQILIDSRTKKISANSFWSSRKGYDSYIKKVTILSDLKIGNAAFCYCESASFEIKGHIEEIGKESFYGCKKIDNIEIKSVDVIPDEAFKNCKSLTSVMLSPKLKSINAKAFEGCDSLETIEIPSAVSFISDSAFSGCIALQNINVDSKNEYYCSIDGTLYNNSVTKLIKLPSGKKLINFIIPDTVNEIGDRAFDSCSSLETIKCSKRLLKFGNNVFAHCEKLRDCYVFLDERSDSKSAWNLGSLLLSLKNAAPETKQNGYNLITKAAELNHPEAQWYLARCFKWGWYGEKNIEQYVSWLKRSAENRKYEAMSELSREYILGKNIPNNYGAAYKLLSDLEKAGLLATLYCKGNFFALLGFLYEHGVIDAKDEKKAVEYYKNGTVWKDSVAEFNMGRCYENGIGLDVDLQKAKEYYSLAKEHKHNGAIEALERVEKLLNTSTTLADDDLPF